MNWSGDCDFDTSLSYVQNWNAHLYTWKVLDTDIYIGTWYLLFIIKDFCCTGLSVKTGEMANADMTVLQLNMKFEYIKSTDEDD